MVKKVIKDIFVKRKKAKPLNEELEMERKSGKRFLSRVVIFTFAFILLIGFGWIILGKISSTIVKITPHQEIMGVDLRLQAGRSQFMESGKSSENSLVFETMQMEKEEARTIIATGIAAGGQKASGQIVVYNNYSAVSQPLIANTRFESPDGKIYRIKERVDIPGMGSKEVTVYADKPGGEYNIGLVDFTIPGLKGGPRYDKVYARSKTEIKGGASGNVMIIKAQDIEKAKSDLQASVKSDLIKSLANQKPFGFLVYQNAVKIEYQYDRNNPKAGDASGSSLFKVKGIATGFLIKENNLSEALVKSKVKDFKKPAGDSKIYVANLKDLEFKLLSVGSENKNINFQIKGNANFAWSVDKERLVKDLIDYKGWSYQKVFQNYPDIEKAEIIIKPLWWRRVSKDKSKIKVEEVIER